MLGWLLGPGGSLDRRFLFSTLLPSLVFCCAVAAILAHARAGLVGALDGWLGQPAGMRWIQLAAFLVVVLLVAQILAGLRNPILRAFEGHWPGWPQRLLAAHGHRWHRYQLSRLGQRATGVHDHGAYRHIYLRYPPPTRLERVMPTRLGNILAAAEVYPHLRYDIDAALVWPRLYQVLPERLLATIARARNDLDALLALSALSGIFALSSASYLLAASTHWRLYLLTLWIGAALAWFAYRSALVSAVTYAQQLRVAFDLYRGALLDELGEPRPHDEAEERDRWARLCVFWYRSIPREHLHKPRVRSARTPEAAPRPRILRSLTGMFVVAVTIAGGLGAVVLGLW